MTIRDDRAVFSPNFHGSHAQHIGDDMSMTPKSIDRISEGYQPNIRRYTYCLKCDKATKGGKPYCTDHVHMNPYAREIARKVANNIKKYPKLDGQARRDSAIRANKIRSQGREFLKREAREEWVALERAFRLG